MKDVLTFCRNKIVRILYKGLFKPVLFRNDPEIVHDQMTRVGIWLGVYSFGRVITKWLFDYQNKTLNQNIFGIKFKNPIGLSAGFDKNAELTDVIPSVGFGFAEVGSITGEKCIGNPKPRLWRLPKSKSLVVYYGLKNDGCETISRRLRDKTFSIPVGVSVAMTNCEKNLDLDEAIKDYAKAFKMMESFGSYITVNISCPNTDGGQPFTDPEKFNSLFNVLDKIPTKKPVFIKISPDANYSELDNFLTVVRKHRIQGIICSNLTKKRDSPKIIDGNLPKVGGISGKVVEDSADKMLSYIYKKEGRKFVLVGSGGVFTAEDAYKKIRLGATLVQMITGMIFEGPQVISEINLKLSKLLKKDGFTSVNQAVGVDVV